MVWVLVVPLFLFVFFGALFQNGVPRDLPVNVVDYDNSALSRKLLRFVDSSPIMAITQHCTNEAEAQRELRRSDVFATVVIPSDFEKDIYQGKSPQALCYINGQFILPVGLIQSAFMTTAGTFSAGIKLDKRQKKGQTYGQAMSDIRNLTIDKHILYNPYMNYSYYSNLAMLPMMFQIVVMVVSAYVIGLVLKRRKAEKLYRLGNMNVWSVLAGKLLPYALLFLFMGWFMNVFLFFNIGVPARGSIVNILVVTALMILAYQAMAVFFVAFSKNLRSALTFGGGFSALAFSFSGYTFPVEGIPKPMVILGQLFPYTHFMKAYVNTAIKGLPLAGSAGSLVALLVFVIIGLLSVSKFSKLLKNNGYEPEY
jgi:ABC-2 type transport system permease protein